MSFLLPGRLRRAAQPRSPDAIFDGKLGGGLSNLRDSIFNSSAVAMETTAPPQRPCTFYLEGQQPPAQAAPTGGGDRQWTRSSVYAGPGAVAATTAAGAPTAAEREREDMGRHLAELQAMRDELVRVQSRLDSQDERILVLRQDLLKRMVAYIDVLRGTQRPLAGDRLLADIKQQFDQALSDQQQLVVALRQSKQKSLARLKERGAGGGGGGGVHAAALTVPSLARQKSRSAETIHSVLDNHTSGRHSNQHPRVAKIKRSETARTADRSPFFGELAKKTGNAIRRNMSLHSSGSERRRRRSSEDLYSPVSKTHLSRSASGAALKSKQSFIQLDPAGQLVFVDNGASPPTTQAQKGKSALPLDSAAPAPQTHDGGALAPQTHDGGAPAPQTQSITRSKSPVPGIQVSQYENMSGRSPDKYSPSKASATKPAAALSTPLDIPFLSKPATGSSRCHDENSSMLSADKDFVEIDDMIHFLQNHKSPSQPLVRGFNAVNSASFREAPTFAVTGATTDSARSELVTETRAKIVIPSGGGGGGDIGGGAHRKPLGETGKPASFDFDLYKRAERNAAPVTSYKPMGVIPDIRIKPETPVKSTTHMQNRVQNGANCPAACEVHRDGVEYASNAMILANLGHGSGTENCQMVVAKSIVTTTQQISSATVQTSASSERSCTQTKHVTKPADSEVVYQNSSEVMSIDLQRGVASVKSDETQYRLQEISLVDLESPLQTSREFYDLVKVKAQGQVVSDNGDIRARDSSVDTSHYARPPKGQQAVENKPRLLKKPPRKSAKLQRVQSRSLTDLGAGGDRPRRRRDRSKSRNKKRPNSFVHDYANIAETCASVTSPCDVTGQTDLNENKNKNDYMNLDLASVPFDLLQNHSTTAQPSSLSSKQPDLVSKCSHSLHPEPSQCSHSLQPEPSQCSPSRRTLRRSVSDVEGPEKAEEERRLLIEEIRKLSELQEDLRDTENNVRVLWANMEAAEHRYRGQEARPKRATLPFAATPPHYPKDKKCVIL